MQTENFWRSLLIFFPSELDKWLKRLSGTAGIPATMVLSCTFFLAHRLGSRASSPIITSPARRDHPRASAVNIIARSSPSDGLSRETADDLTGSISIWDGFNRRSDFNEFDEGAD